MRDKIERIKIKAERLDKEEKRIFIIDINNSYIFADILIIGETNLMVKAFKGNYYDENHQIAWEDILRLEEYKERQEDD